MSDNQSSPTSHTSAYQIITDYAVQALQKGIVPWQQPCNIYGLPRNISSGYIYTEWNAIYLNSVTHAKQYPTPMFLTFKQALKMGGNVRRGEKGYPVAFWKKITNQYRSIGTETEQDRSYNRDRMICSIYWVFNIEQTENVSCTFPSPVVKSLRDQIEFSKKMVELMPHCPPIRQGGETALYSPSLDYIQIPEITEYVDASHYYTCLFHKLAQSTGHPDRLHRSSATNNKELTGSSCAREELTAEFTTSMLCAITGIGRQPTDESPEQIQQWLQRLREDKTLVLKASSQARAATDYILGIPKASRMNPTSEEADAHIAGA